MPESKNKKKKKKQPVVKPSPEKKRISKGQKRYMLASDVKEAAESYEAQAQEEAEKAGKRSLWSTVGGVLGAGIGIMAAPALIGAAAGVGLLGSAAAAAGAGSLATGIGTSLIVGGGSAFGGRRGKEAAESKKFGKAKRKDIEVDKFYTKAAEEATETFKDYDKTIDRRIKQQAVVSGALAGFQAGGGFKKAGEWTKKGLGIGDKAGAGATFDPSIVKASDIGGTSDKLAYTATKGAGSQADLVGHQLPTIDVTPAGATTNIASPSISTYPMASDPTFAFGSASNKSLYSLLRENIGKNILSSGVGMGLNALQSPPPSINDEPDEINFPSYT